jgi:hypothetical protein
MKVTFFLEQKNKKSKNREVDIPEGSNIWLSVAYLKRCTLKVLGGWSGI